MKQKRLSRALAGLVALLLAATALVPAASAKPAGATDTTIEPGELAVVNFAPVWGDKEANKQSILDYMKQADEQGVRMILFPEMCLTGYASSSDPNSEIYQMAVSQAETTTSPITQEIASYADEYDMWVFFGTSEKIPGDNEHAYNSEFACSPDGAVTSYQKITPVEGSWCTPGQTPVMVDTEWGRVGLSICYDTYATPELERYYAAKGCGIVLNPTATSRGYTDLDGDGVRDDQGWEWYYKNRLESITSREGILIASANLVGGDGPIKPDGSSTYNFPGGSVIVAGGFDGGKYYAGANGTDIITATEGMLSNTAKINLGSMPSSTCKVSSDFHPDDYAKWYKELADKQAAGESLSYSSDVTDGPVAAVANVSAKWGDKAANLEMMISYIEQAAEKDVDILVFPETVLTGYSCEDPETDGIEGDQYMQVALAETIPGPSTNIISEYAKQYGMYIIFGMPERTDTPIYEDLYGETVEKVYNSAAICKPDGTVDSYQKMHRAGIESYWSVCGDTPYMLDTEWGKIGVDICRDGHFYPELGRYYAAMGCTMLIHPTATTGGPWYRETRIGSYTDRDGMAAITCNLLGPDGIYNEEWDSWSGGVFASTSLIITKYHDENGRVSFDPETGSAIDLNGTGSASEGFEERGTSPEGLEIAKMDLSGCGFRISNFNPLLFAKMYDELATESIAGYQSIFSTNKTTLDQVIAYAEAQKTSPAFETAIPLVQQSFTDALEAAKLVQDSKFATQQQIDQAWIGLMNEIHKLGFVKADQTTLRTLYAYASGLEMDLYADGQAKTAFLTALETAAAVIADENAMADSVDPAYSALIEAVSALRFKADKSVLDQLLTQASGIDLTLYTNESAVIFQAAFAEAQTVYQDTTLSVDDQAEVDRAAADLQVAIGGLTLPQAAPSESAAPNASAAESVSDGSKVIAGDATAAIRSTSAPRTGESDVPVAASTLLILAVAAAVAVRKRNQ